MSETRIATAMRISSMAKRLLFGGLLFDPAWMGLHELTPAQEDDDDREQEINSCERGEWHDQSGHRSHRVSGPHKPIDDPGLSSKFGYKPAGLYCNEAERRRTNQRA